MSTSAFTLYDVLTSFRVSLCDILRDFRKRCVLWNVWIIYKVKLRHRALKTLKSLGWESGERARVCMCVRALCTLLPTRIHPQLPVGGLSHSQPPLSITDIQSTLTSFLPSSVSSLSSFLSLSAPLSPQITAVFTRALRDLPTRPRVRSHSPHQAKKNPPKSYQASCLLTHWLPVCGCDVPVCVCVCRCMLRQPCSLPQFFEHKILIPSFTHSIMSRSLYRFTLLPWCGVSLISLQAYIVNNAPPPSRLAFFSPTYTCIHRPTLCCLPLWGANGFLLITCFSFGGTLIPGAALCGHLMAGIEQ